MQEDSDPTTYCIESHDDQRTYQMENLYALIYKLCNLDFCTVENIGDNFGGGNEPCVLLYARKMSKMVMDISRYNTLQTSPEKTPDNVGKESEEDWDDGEKEIEDEDFKVLTVHEHFDKSILGLHYIS